MIKNALLGGTDWESPSRIKPVDLNDTFDAVVGDLSEAVKLIGLNALNILDLTAQSSLTVGINGNFERDIYTDTNGYLNTIDTINTTAKFTSNYYENIKLSSLIKSDNTETSISTNQTVYHLMKTISDINDYVKEHTNEILAGSTFSISCRVQFNYEDATSATFTTTHNTSSYSLKTYPNPEKEKKVNSIQIYLKLNEERASNVTIRERLDKTYSTDQNSNKIIQTNPQTIESGFTKFMIVSNEETTGTGSVSYDITFNSDADTPTYQEDLESFKEYSIEEAGTSLILKQKLNAGANYGEALAYNWGVLLW